MIRSLSLLCLVASIVGTSARVSADVVEPGFVESCTLEQIQQAHPGETCIACSTYYAEATRCDTELTEGGYTQACRSRGASTWIQIGCRAGAATNPRPAVTPEPAPAPAPAPPPPSPAATPSPEPSSSTCTIGGTTATPWSLVFGACAFLVALRRRKLAQ